VKPTSGLRSDSESDEDLSPTDINDRMGLKKDDFNIGTNNTTFETTLKDLLNRKRKTDRYDCVDIGSNKKAKLTESLQDNKNLKLNKEKNNGVFPRMEIFDDKEKCKAVEEVLESSKFKVFDDKKKIIENFKQT
jgi:hypothetical protein